MDYKKRSSSTWLDVSGSTTSSARTVSGLESGTRYDFRVRANGDGSNYQNEWGAWSSTASATTHSELGLPPAPSNFSARATGSDRILLTWSSVSGTDGYEMDYKKRSSSTWLDVSGSTTSSARTVTGLESGTRYDFRVRANGDGSNYQNEWGAWSSTASATTLNEPSTSISISGVDTSMKVGESDSFTISASNLDTSRSYTVRLTTSDSDAGFNSSCSDRSDTINIPANRSSYTTSHTVYACREGSARLEAELRRGSTVEDDASSTISVSAPNISISGLDTTLTVGESDSFSVEASGLSTSLSYNIRIDAESGLAFDAECTDRRYDYTVPARSSSATRIPTVYARAAGSHDIDAEIRRGTTADDDDSETITVTAESNPEGEIEISGLDTSMTVGESDSFTISASNLDTSRNYTIRLTTSDSDAGFNSSCSDRSDTIDVPANSISYTSSHTVYACDEDSADLEAQLRIGTTTEDDASSRISISAPTVSISGLETTLTVGESDSFRVQASGLSASLSYNIRIDAESGLAFNSACTDRRYDYTVPSNSSSAIVSPTVYACSVGNHSLQFKIRRGTVIDSQASETLAVYRCRNTTVVSDYASNPLLVADCETLLELKDALAGTATLNWGTDSAITSWDGVTLGGTPTRVVRIDLVDKSLTGSIPPKLGDLSALQVLDLRRNSLTGSIPPQLGGIASLQSLQLSKNLLDGDIPSEIAGLTSLIRLGINDNSFTGSIPSFFGDYENLEHLWLKGNSFAGPIPSSLGDLDSLNELNIAPNSGLTGCVPVGLRDVETNDTADLGLPYCDEPMISISGLETTIAVGESDSFSVSADNLESSNAYTINISTSKTSILKFNSCNSYGNASDSIDVATGTTGTSSVTVNPVKLYACTKGRDTVTATLTSGESTVAMSAPQNVTVFPGAPDQVSEPTIASGDGSRIVSWSAPGDRGSPITGYQVRHRRAAHSTWLISSWLSKSIHAIVGLTNGVEYEAQVRAKNDIGDGLWSDTATGTPETSPCRNAVSNYASNPLLVADCETLLELKDALAGTATLNWGTDSAITSWDGVTLEGTPTRVVRIELSGESLNGVLPPQLGNLSALQVLDLRRNNLTGSIPPQLGGITSLQSLQLSRNSLGGTVPSELAGLTSLIRLGINDNSFTGPIPSSLGDLDSLDELNIAPNSGLTGCVPVGLRDVETNDTADLGLPYCDQPVISISGLAMASLQPAQIVTFGVTAENLDTSQTYEINVSTSGTPILKFNSCNSDDGGSDSRQIATDTTGTASVTVNPVVLYACAEGSDTVTAILISGGNIVATSALRNVTVSKPLSDEFTTTLNLRANSDSSHLDGSQSQAMLRWDAHPDALSYKVRYGHECVNESETFGIVCNPFEPNWTSPVTLHSSTTSYTIDSEYLLPQRLYRIQVGYIENVNGPVTWSVPTFTYPTKFVPSGPVASVPFYGHQSSQSYSFVICENTFDSISNPAEYYTQIEAGIATWKTAVQWMSGNVNIIDSSRDTTRTTCPSINIINMNNSYSEVRMGSRWAMIFRCLAFGFNPTMIKPACAPAGDPDQTIATLIKTGKSEIPSNVDIFFYEGHRWDPSTSDAYGCTNLARLASHEAGHVFGVKAHHSTIRPSIMNPVPRTCVPQPYDLAAMMALYQSHTRH